MPKLTSKKRNALPDSSFAGPDRTYPVEDKGHAIAAKGRATEAVKKGRMSKSAEAKIDAKANRVLGHSSDGKGHWSGH